MLTGIPFLGANGSRRARRVGLDRPDARRRRHDRRPRRAPGRAPPVRPGRRISTRRRGQLPAGSLTGAIALVERGVCPFTTKADAGEGGRRDRDRLLRQPRRRGQRHPCEARASGRDDRRPRRRPSACVPRGARRPDDDSHRPRPARARDRAQRRDHELLLRRPDRVRPRSQARRRRARRADPLLDAAEYERLALRGVRRHDDGDAARRRRRGAAARAASRLDARAGEVGARLDRRRRLGRHRANAGGARDARGRRARITPERGRPPALHRSRLAVVRRPRRDATARRAAPCSSASPTPATVPASWHVALAPQAATAGTSIDIPGAITVPPGGEADVAVVARAGAGAPEGEDYGFVVLRKGGVTRRIPYFFLVDRPALADAPIVTLKRQQSGDTRNGTSRVSAYRYPVAPFGNAPDTPPMVEDGAETLYQTLITRPAVNAGVSVISETPARAIDPFYLGARDENTVQGFAGTPVNVNALTSGYLAPHRRGRRSVPPPATLLRRGRLGSRSVHRTQSGRPLRAALLGQRRLAAVDPAADEAVAAGRPRFVLRVRDSQSGVDPSSLTIGYQGVLVGASSYDPDTGIAVFSLPATAPAFDREVDRRATRRLRLPGGEEHRHRRAVDHAEHPLEERADPDRAGNGRHLGAPGFGNMSREAAGRSLSPRARPRRSRVCASSSTAGRSPSRSARTACGLHVCRPRAQQPGSTRSPRSRRSPRAGPYRRGVSCERARGDETGRSRHRCVVRHRRGARARACAARLALRAARAPRGAAAPTRRGDRRRVRDLRRLRSCRRRRDGRTASSSAIRASRCS